MRSPALLALALATATGLACHGDRPPAGDAAAAGEAPAGASPAGEAADTSRSARSGLHFVDATPGSGLDAFRQVNGHPDKPTVVDSVGGGCAFLDHDGDGDLDVYLTNGARPPGEDTGEPPRDALFENLGGMRFRDVTARAGLGDEAWTNGVVLADVDGDGHSDLYLTNHGPNVLARARGDGTFEDVTRALGVGGDSWSTGAAFFDADGDRDLDLFVANYVDFDPDFVPADPTLCTYRGEMVFYGPRGLAPSADRFYRNEGGRFVDATAEAGIDDRDGYGFQVIAFDADQDGDVDVFVANDSTPNHLWINDGSGRFSESGLLSGMALSEAGREQASMGAALGDLDGDGLLDVYVTNFSEDYHTLYRAEGRGTYSDATLRFDLGESTFPSLGWGCSLLDADNDGDLDVFAANGHVYPQVDAFDFGQSYLQANQLFEQVGPGSFRERTEEAGSGFGIRAASRGSAVGDVDDDGDLDLLVGNIDGPPTLLRNETDTTGAWIRVALRGRPPNTDAIGAVVVVEAGDRRLTQAVLSGNGFLSVDDRRLHFGLGAAETASATVTWPDGSRSRHEDLAARRLHVLAEGGSPARP